MPHVNNLSPAQIERLALLAEECSEVIQIINKIIRHGYNSHHPNNPHESNRELLETELGHVRFASDLMEVTGDVRTVNIGIAQENKQDTVSKYLHYNKV